MNLARQQAVSGRSRASFWLLPMVGALVLGLVLGRLSVAPPAPEPPAPAQATQGAAAMPGLVPLEQLVERAQQRYEVELLDASLTAARRHERARAVHELRMLTRDGHVLRFRFDALSGDWLEIDGRGQIEARRPLPEAG